MAKNLAPVLVVTVQIIPPTTLMSIRLMMCRLRSSVRPEDQVANKDTRNVAIHTGAVIKRVSMLLYPRVCTIVGKKYWKFCDRSEVC
jgi:hypothetical protein